VLDIALALDRITKQFGPVVAVRDVSLRVRRGEFVSLLGPSGCGKTTMLRMVAGYLRPDRGAIYLDDRDETCTPPYRRDIGMVFQSYALFPHMTVEQNVAFGLRMRRVGNAEITRRVAEALQLVRLAGFERRKPAEISGGQQQRVALARAIVIRPRLLLLDEPLSNLDAKLRKSMQLEIRSLQETLGITTIHVTHDQSEALSLSDRVVIMNQGEIQQVGPPREVYVRPQSVFVADFVGESNLLHGRVTEIAEGGDAITVELDSGERLSAPVPTDSGTTSVGARVCVVVRPETIEMFSADTRLPTGNAFAGVIDRIVYTGALSTTLISLPSGLRLTVEGRSDEAERPCLEPKQAVVVSLPASSLLVVSS
jgi:spermidine/putrescine ABC transporter ATP-binding subunit